jgi:hypothetical protein
VRLYTGSVRRVRLAGGECVWFWYGRLVVEGDARSAAKFHLIQSDDAEPLVRLTPGKRYQVVATAVVDSDLQAIDVETEMSGVRPARLCGSRSTCVAIVEIE